MAHRRKRVGSVSDNVVRKRSDKPIQSGRQEKAQACRGKSVVRLVCLAVGVREWARAARGGRVAFRLRLTAGADWMTLAGRGAPTKFE